jgi:thioredoxin-related protein
MNKILNQTASLLVLFIFCSLGTSYGQVMNAVTFHQLDSLQKSEQKPVLVFIHTSWCKYCKAMEHTTFQDQKLKELLNKSFYFIELNAEEKREIIVKGQTFRYRPNGTGAGQHELAQELGMIDGKISFPTLSFLNADYEIIYQQPGFLTAKELMEILKVLNKQVEKN